MQTDIADLRDFYRTPLGLVTQRLLCGRVGEMWPNVRGERVLTFGYGVPLISFLSRQAAAALAFMPAAQGAECCPGEGTNLSCLVTPKSLPLGDGSVDCILALHALESLAEPEPVLREFWRVLKGNGRLLLVVPNRQGLWAHNDRTPFGNGQPYSKMQIKRLLKQQGFFVDRLRGALYAPPIRAPFNLSLAERTEKVAARVLPSFGGVLMVEASKQICAPIEAKAKSRQRIILPLPVPASCRNF